MHHIDEFRSQFSTKQLIWSIFPNQLGPKSSWLYLNLFEFKVDYFIREEANNVIVEEIRVKIEDICKEPLE